MSTLKDKLLDELIAVEGGYVNDPSDSGGETKYGITLSVARRNGYKGDMRDLSIDFAKKVYSEKYWDRLNLDSILFIAPEVAQELFDTGVNMGVKRAGEFLQRSLNVFDAKANLVVDGKVGPRTLRVLSTFIDKRGYQGDRTLKRALDSLQGAFYIKLAERRVKDKRFIYGWFKNRIG